MVSGDVASSHGRRPDGDRDRRRLIVVAAVLAGAALGLLLLRQVQVHLKPEPVRAWVAIETPESAAAVVGNVMVPAGTRCRLHAVLEAASADGSRIFFTEATALRLPEGDVSPTAIRPWDGDEESVVLWFSVEGFRPFWELDASDDLEALHFEELFRAEWPRAWSVPAVIRAMPSALGGETSLPEFGIQRYHVRVELYGSGTRLAPEKRFRSWGADDVLGHESEFPTLVASLPGALAPASELFGLTQIEPPSGGTEVLLDIADLTRRRLAYSRTSLLASVLDRLGLEAGELDWSAVDLAGGVEWGGPGVVAGDWARVGERVVLLLEDRGRASELDYDDLCLDFERGGAIRSLGEIFEGGGLVEWAPVRPRAGS